MKIKFTLTFLILALVALVGIESCKNDIEIFAPESDVTLIYGLLSSHDQVHQIKINRVFQGTDAIEKLAKDPKLSEYDNLSASLIELNDNGFGSLDTVRKWLFTERTITTKDSGYFYYPNQKIYELDQKLDSSKLYAIEVDKLNGSPIVSSTTELIQVMGDIIIKPFGLNFLGLGLCDKDGPIDNIGLELSAPLHTKVMDVYLDFSYQDEDLNNQKGDIITLQYYVGKSVVTSVPTQPGDNGTIKMDLNPTSFYEFIAANVPVVQPGDDIKQRVPLDEPLNFRFVSGGDELNTYTEVASPSTSLLETKPEYTNVINGVGLWSTRSFDNKIAKMSTFSIDYLVNGDITAGRKFCHYTSNTDPLRCY